VRILTTLILALVATPASADTCEAVRAAIEDKIRAAGVEVFSVRVIEAAASAPGKVVGNCAQGSKKIVYLRGEVDAPPKAAAPPVITECKDGSAPVDGRCGN